MSDPQKLLPCPFCNGEALLGNGGPGCHFVYCSTCNATSDDGTAERSIAAWNRRATPPGDKTLREALEKSEADIKALIALFETDVVFVGTGWAKFPDASAGTWPEVCVNISNYGADAEDIPRSEWQTVASLTEEFGSEAPEAWAAWRRGLDDTPKPSLGPKGKEALEALKDRAALSHGEDDNG